MTLETLGTFSPEATGVGRAGDGPELVVGTGGMPYPCTAQPPPPPCLWPVLTVQLLTTFIFHPEDCRGHLQSMYFQVLRGSKGWLGGYVFPTLGPYTAPLQMRHMLAHGVSKAVVQAQAWPWWASCHTSRGRARKRNTSRGRRGSTLGSLHCF